MRSRGEGEIEGEIGVIVRRAARSTRGAIDERTRRTIALLVNRATRRLTSDALTIAIDEGRDQRARSSDDRIARRSTSGAIFRRARLSIDGRRDRRRSLFFLSLSLSLRFGLSLFSLPLSLSLSFRK